MDLSALGLAQLILGSLIACVGLLALVGSLLGRRRIDPLLGSFGAFSLLWGTRLFFGTPLIGAFGVSQVAAAWVGGTITYLINVPAWLFFQQLIGRGWRATIFWGVRVMAVFAVVGVVSDLIQGRPASLNVPNSLLVIAGITLLGVTLWESRNRMTRELRLLTVGLAVFGITALNDNLTGMGLLPWTQRLETAGFVFYAGCLGVIAVRRFFLGEAQLAALESELKTAREIQMSILPGELPATRDLSVAARFRPTSEVAGDYYDFLQVDGRSIGVVVADVSGHGVPAALIASMVKIAVASQSDSCSRPAGLLSEVNRVLCGSFRRGFVTATYAWFDGTSDELIVANAGHPAPLLRRAGDGTVHEVGGHGPILGRFHGAGFEERSLHLEHGDRLVFYTDGITEASGPGGEQFGDERLRAFVGRAGHDRPEAFCDALLDELRRWSGTGVALALDDDVTLVVVDYRPPAG